MKVHKPLLILKSNSIVDSGPALLGSDQNQILCYRPPLLKGFAPNLNITELSVKQISKENEY